MADATLSDKLPRAYARMRWPIPFETGNATALDGIGSVTSRVPTPRERLLSYLEQKYFGETLEGRNRAEYFGGLADLALAPGFASYDTTRAVGEGRYTDAIVPGLTVVAPFLGKPLKSLWAAARKPRADGFFNPKPKPARDFAKDYPQDVTVDEYGDIARDIEGRPLSALYRAGRIRPGEPDKGLTPIDIQRVGEYTIEDGIEMVPPEMMPPGTLGRTWKIGKEPVAVQISEGLPKAHRDVVMGHEIGHVIDQAAGEIPTEGLDEELDFIYNALRTGKERKYFQRRPQDFNYQGSQMDRERAAEAIRAYMVDPNYMKTVAPKTSAVIRDVVNPNPRLNKIVQFNNIAPLALGAAAGGLAMTGQSGESRANNQGVRPTSPIPPAPRPESVDLIARALLNRQGRLTFGGPR